jgi:hypothetical protein
VTLGASDDLSVNANLVHARIGFSAGFGDDRAVDGNMSPGDEFFGFAAGGDSGSGKYFL